jgi:hypothetical protein
VGVVLALLRVWRRDGRAERFLLVTAAATVLTFLHGRSYFTQYHAHLALIEALLAGYAAGTAWRWLGATAATRRVLRPVLAVALVAVLVLPARQAVRVDRAAHTDDLVHLAAFLDERVPPGACVFAFEPAWALVADRLPAVPDPYAAMLLPTIDDPSDYESVSYAFEAPSSQQAMVRRLSSCEWVVAGGRGPAQLSKTSEAWFAAHFVRRYPAGATAGPDVWQRRPTP